MGVRYYADTESSSVELLAMGVRYYADTESSSVFSSML